MKATFDMPEPLLREARAVAAQQGRRLRDLVAHTLVEKLSATAAARARGRPRSSEWKAFAATLIRRADGSYFNPDGNQDANFIVEVEAARNTGPIWPTRDRFTDER